MRSKNIAGARATQRSCFVASGSRPSPETPFGTRGLTSSRAFVTQHPLATGSRAARRSSATPTSDQRRVGGLCDPECLLPDSTTRRSSRSRGAPRPDAPPTTGFWLPFSGEVRREGRTRALPCNTLEQGRYEIWGHYGTTPTSIPAAHEHGSPRFGAFWHFSLFHALSPPSPPLSSLLAPPSAICQLPAPARSS